MKHLQFSLEDHCSDHLVLSPHLSLKLVSTSPNPVGFNTMENQGQVYRVPVQRVFSNRIVKRLVRDNVMKTTDFLVILPAAPPELVP